MSGTRNALAVAFSRHFMAVTLLNMHQIFLLAFAGLRGEGEVAQAGALERQKEHHEDIFISK